MKARIRSLMLSLAAKATELATLLSELDDELYEELCSDLEGCMLAPSRSQVELALNGPLWAQVAQGWEGFGLMIAVALEDEAEEV